MQKIALITLMTLAPLLSHAQTCQSNIKNKTPDSRYQLLNNGSEVKDLKTGLVWQRCSLGQTWDGTTCAGEASSYTWQQALQAAQTAGNGWTLPNINELLSLANRSCYLPAINDTFFPNTPFDSSHNYGRVWSSSPVAYYGDYAWDVYFGHGYGGLDYKRYALFVRLVRASQ
jgi:hypothetical protein